MRATFVGPLQNVRLGRLIGNPHVVRSLQRHSLPIELPIEASGWVRLEVAPTRLRDAWQKSPARVGFAQDRKSRLHPGRLRASTALRPARPAHHARPGEARAHTVGERRARDVAEGARLDVPLLRDGGLPLGVVAGVAAADGHAVLHVPPLVLGHSIEGVGRGVVADASELGPLCRDGAAAK